MRAIGRWIRHAGAGMAGAGLVLALGAAEAQEFTLKYAHVGPATEISDDQIPGEFLKFFLEGRSQGRIKVEIYPASQLGREFVASGGTVYVPTAEERATFMAATDPMKEWFLANADNAKEWLDAWDGAIAAAEAEIDADRARILGR